MMGANARFSNFTMTLPKGGPISVPDSENFLANVASEIDLSQLIDNGWVDFISGVYIDNTQNTGYLTFVCAGTNQRFYFPAKAAGYVPLFLPNSPKVTVTSTEDATVLFQWYNIPVFPLILPGPTEPGLLTEVDINSIAGIPITGENLPVAIDASITLPVSFTNTPYDLTDYHIALSGGNDTLLTAGVADHYVIIQNPLANAAVTVNLAGGDSTAEGIVIQPGGSYENDSGIFNAITISGTATQIVQCFAG